MEIERLLENKRDGKELNESEIKQFVDYLVKGNITDAQIGAMLMAMFIRGITTAETIIMTKAMLNSGDSFNWNPEWNGILVGKHSTGGVGDKVSIVLAPALAACGLKVPMLSGRYLAFTGGTLDKLESIPGFNCKLSKKELQKCMESAGCFITGATKNLCPADKILYAKRNETSTIDYVNLIACSIISKKAVEGIKHLILDIKVGRGAFMKDIKSATALAKQLVYVSNQVGIKTKAVVTKMDNPLGRAVGNSLEIVECIDLMKGTEIPQVQDLVAVFGGILLEMSGKTRSQQEGEEMVKDSLRNGNALKHFHEMLIHQGVSIATSNALCYGCESDLPLPLAKYKTEILADESGWIEEIDALTIGLVCQKLTNTTSENNLIDLSTGVYINKTIGEQVQRKEAWLTVYHSTPNISDEMKHQLEKSLKVTSNGNKLAIIIENKNLILDCM